MSPLAKLSVPSPYPSEKSPSMPGGATSIPILAAGDSSVLSKEAPSPRNIPTWLIRNIYRYMGEILINNPTFLAGHRSHL